MLPASFLICWYFYTRLKYVNHKHRYRGFWSVVFGCVVFASLLVSQTYGMLFGTGRLGSGYMVNNMARYVAEFDIHVFEALVLSAVLGGIFYATANIGTYVEDRYYGGFIVVPGMLLAVVVAIMYLQLFS